MITKDTGERLTKKKIENKRKQENKKKKMTREKKPSQIYTQEDKWKNKIQKKKW